MFLFLIGVAVQELVLFLLFVLGFGLLIFWLTKKVLRLLWKDGSEQKIKLISRLSAIILSPVLLIGSLALFIYSSIPTTPKESEGQHERDYYQMMEENLRADLKVGLTKSEVVGLLGEADTTQSVLTYDLSLEDAKEKYVLEITFDTKGLKDFKRKR
jgi:hypothetical protein